MTIQKFTTALLLSVSLIYFCAADCMINKPQIVSSNSIENSITGAHENDAHKAKDNENSRINRSAYGVVPILYNIKKEVVRHYTGMLPQKQDVYHRA